MSDATKEIENVGSKVSAGAKLLRALLELLGIAPKSGPKVDKLPPRQ